MADYLLAAHIQVTGGAEAAMQLNQVVTQINNFGAAARNAGGGTMASDMDKAASSGGALSSALDRVGTAMIRMGTYMGIRAVVDTLREAADGVLDFDQAMTNSLAIQTGVTDSMRNQMEDMAESLAVRFGEAPAKVAEGFYFMASAGLSAQQQIATLPTVMEFARAGMMSLDSATEMLFDSLSAIGQKSDDPQILAHNLTNLSDTLTEAAIKSQATIEQMGAALSNKAGASIKAFNLDLNESVGVLEVFANQGIKGSTAGERFSMLIRDMALKSQKFGEDWARMGVQVFDSQGNFNSLVTIFSQLDAALLPLSGQDRIKALKDMGFTLRDISTVMSVLGTSGALAGFVLDLENAGGVAERVANIQMESLRAKLAQLKSASIVFAIEGFERLEEVGAWLVGTFSPAVSSIVDLLGQMGGVLGPAASDLGRLATGATASGLQELASIIERVFSAIASHPGAVEALSASLVGLGSGVVIGNLLQLGVAIGETLYLKVLMAQDAINKFAVSMRTMDAAAAIDSLKSAWTGLLNLLNNPFVVGAGIGLFIYSLVRQFEDGKHAADDFVKAITKDLDLHSLGGLEQAVQRVSAEYERLQAQNQQNADGGFFSKLSKVALTELDAITPGFYKFSGNLATLKGELAGTGNALDTLTAARDNIRTGFDMISGAIEHTGQFATNTVHTFDATTSKMRDMGEVARAAGVQVDTSAPALERLAKAANIDISAGWSEWAPLLEEAAIKSALVGDNAGVLGDQMVTLSDDAATAADKLKAFKDVLDQVFGVPLSSFEAFTQVEQSLMSLSEGLAKFKEEGGDINNAFDATSKKGLELRDSLSGAAEGALDYARAIADEQGMDAAVAGLSAYRERIVAVLQTQGLSTEAANAMADSLGLTAANIAGVRAAAGDGIKVPVSAPGADETKAKIDGLGGDKKTTVTVTDNGTAQTVTVTIDAAAAPRTSPVIMSAEVAEAEIGLNTAARARSSPTVMTAEVAEAEIGLNTAARPRTSPTVMTAEVAEAEIGFNNAARPRTSPAVMTAEVAEAEIGFNNTTRARTSPAIMTAEVAEAEIGFNNTTRGRTAPATMDGDWAVAEIGFDTTARFRTSPATQQANTGGAESDLNTTARGRSSTVTASANTGGAEAALDALTATRYATIAINVAYTSSGAPPGVLSTVAAAEGGIIHAYAYGGFENHVAQIGRAGRSGVTRLWNEPETGGEAYIPLAPSKRDRSLAVWEETGRMLGAATSAARNVNVHVPINVSVDGSSDPAVTAQAVASHVKSGVDAALSRVLIELRSA